MLEMSGLLLVSHVNMNKPNKYIVIVTITVQTNSFAS